MEFYLYILKTARTNQYYKGITNNLFRRLRQHNIGQVNFTKNKRPLHLVFVEVCESRIIARKLEKLFKSGYGREMIQEIEETLNI